MIVTRNPFGAIDRAVMLEALVEEIPHAAHYHSIFPPPLPSCQNITVYETESWAKLGALFWMGRSGIESSAFAAFYSETTYIDDILQLYPNLFAPQFRGNCPGEVSPLPPSFLPPNQLASFEFNIGCIDPLV